VVAQPSLLVPDRPQQLPSTTYSESGDAGVSITQKPLVVAAGSEKALVQLGLIKVHGASEFTQCAHLELNIDAAC
jgi:hypothetical protein